MFAMNYQNILNFLRLVQYLLMTLKPIPNQSTDRNSCI